MKRILSLVFFVGVLASVTPFSLAAFAQAAQDDTPAAKEDIEKLFTTLHLRDLMRNVIETSQKQMKETMRVTLKKKMPDISQKDLDRIDAMSSQTLKSLDMDGMLDDMIPVYQRHLTKGDVAAMLTFYQSPTGQKMLREQPQMMAEAMKAVQPRMEKMMSDVMEQAEKMAKDVATEEKSNESTTK